MRILCVIMVMLAGCVTVSNPPFEGGMTLVAVSVDGQMYDIKCDDLQFDGDDIIVLREGKEVSRVGKDQVLMISISHDVLIKETMKDINVKIHRHDHKPKNTWDI